MAPKKTKSQIEIDTRRARLESAEATVEEEKKALTKLESEELVAALANAVSLANSLTGVSPEAIKLVKSLNKACGIKANKKQGVRKSDEDKDEYLDSFLSNLEGKTFTLPGLQEHSKEHGFDYAGSAGTYFKKQLDARTNSKAIVVDSTKKPAIWSLQ